MTNPVSEPVHETADDLFTDDELSDEALDRAAGQGVKATGTVGPVCMVTGPSRVGRSPT